jgi:hypothetical protein
MQSNATYPLNCDALDRLPLFATDKEIATALLGSDRAARWARENLPVLAAKRGFPPKDSFHGGRPVPLVRIFYQNYLRLVGDFPGVPDGVDRVGMWKGVRKSIGRQRQP